VAAHPCVGERAKLEVADIVRAHRAELEATHWVTLEQRRVLSAMALCRTAALGGHLDVCRSCHMERLFYHSCRNRHCPKCQALAQERWIAARAEQLLPVGHFHAVFTVPGELRSLAQRAPRVVYDALFHAASETLQELGRTRVDATLGITMVLHTWTRELQFHPHVHAIVTAGGLAASGWKPMSLKYLFPVDVMGELLRGKMQTRLRELHRAGELPETNASLKRLMQQLEEHDSWVVYVKKAFRHAEHVLKYLGRYTHRVAISNSRLVSKDQDHVRFRTKNGKVITLESVEFLRRFVQHVLPKGFQKIRHYGLYASAANDSLQQAHALLHSSNSDETRVNIDRMRTWQAALKELTGRDVNVCPKCGGQVEHQPLAAHARAPPETRRAA
jgi:hypothetical protein